MLLSNSNEANYTMWNATRKKTARANAGVCNVCLTFLLRQAWAELREWTAAVHTLPKHKHIRAQIGLFSRLYALSSLTIRNQVQIQFIWCLLVKFNRCQAYVIVTDAIFRLRKRIRRILLIPLHPYRFHFNKQNRFVHVISVSLNGFLAENTYSYIPLPVSHNSIDDIFYVRRSWSLRNFRALKANWQKTDPGKIQSFEMPSTKNWNEKNIRALPQNDIRHGIISFFEWFAASAICENFRWCPKKKTECIPCT